MPTTSNQIAFRYHPTDSATGVTRATVKRLAEQLGVDETEAIHLALHDLAAKVLQQYEADDGPLTAAQLRQIREQAPDSSMPPVAADIAALKKASMTLDKMLKVKSVDAEFVVSDFKAARRKASPAAKKAKATA